jgi:hypothetical protein
MNSSMIQWMGISTFYKRELDIKLQKKFLLVKFQYIDNNERNIILLSSPIVT